MTRAELISRVSEGVKESKKHTESMLNAFLFTIERSLIDGHDVVLHGFGKFSVTKRAGRTGRNPRTGEPVAIPAKKFVKFTVQKKLKEAVQG